MGTLLVSALFVGLLKGRRSGGRRAFGVGGVVMERGGAMA